MLTYHKLCSINRVSPLQRCNGSAAHTVFHIARYVAFIALQYCRDPFLLAASLLFETSTEARLRRIFSRPAGRGDIPGQILDSLISQDLGAVPSSSCSPFVPDIVCMPLTAAGSSSRALATSMLRSSAISAAAC